MEKPLNLVILYNAALNIYSVSAHNQTSLEAQSLLQKFEQHLKPGWKLLIIEQQKTHKTENAQDCKACRNTVVRSSGLTPTPAFKRRKP
jgi:hypothetical protein